MEHLEAHGGATEQQQASAARYIMKIRPDALRIIMKGHGMYELPF